MGEIGKEVSFAWRETIKVIGFHGSRTIGTSIVFVAWEQWGNKFCVPGEGIGLARASGWEIRFWLVVPLSILDRQTC